MKRFPAMPLLAALLFWSPPLSAQFDPPGVHKPDAATMKAITEKTERLGKAIAELRKKDPNHRNLPDVEIFHKAAVWIVRHNEFYDKNAGAWTVEALDEGLKRASQLAEGNMPWMKEAGRTVVRGYRSEVDGSVQPFAVTFPADYFKEPARLHRFDVVLHGRDNGLTEVKFLHQHGAKPAGNQDFVRLDVYGRGNNAYRWSGETDVTEAQSRVAVENLDPTPRINPMRVVLRGFSMGGAGTWHLGLHDPGKWCVIGPGAGFTTTHGYIKGLPQKLPPYQEKCLRIYDALDYAENAFNVPVVAYSGEKDPQKAAADSIEKRLKELNIPMTHLVAPGLAHNFPAEWQKKAEAEYARYANGPLRFPTSSRFVTYTLAYPGKTLSPITIFGLNRHYERARVEMNPDGSGFIVKTENVRIVSLNVRGKTAKVDGQQFDSNKGDYLVLEHRDGKWTQISFKSPVFEQVRKSLRLHGPIDDAFIHAFLCVRGTGKPWHAATGQYVHGDLDRFRNEWNKFLRGDLPIKQDKEVTADDIKGKHLILFGDPASNTLIAKALARLPLEWTKDKITFAGKTVSSADHVPVMIFPNPLNPKRYIVLNSGHTFHEPDFCGTNALLYPRLGDYALLKLAPTAKDPLGVEVVTAGIFDEEWRVPKE